MDIRIDCVDRIQKDNEVDMFPLQAYFKCVCFRKWICRLMETHSVDSSHIFRLSYLIKKNYADMLNCEMYEIYEYCFNLLKVDHRFICNILVRVKDVICKRTDVN